MSCTMVVAKRSETVKQAHMLLGIILVSYCSVQAVAEQLVRVATYNIKFLNSDIGDSRLEHLRSVIDELDADVIGLQEIDDRAALRKIFSNSDWQIVIDDQSGDNQDLALAIRCPLHVQGRTCDSTKDIDADESHFLFEEESNFAFPRDRDILFVEIEIPSVQKSFFVMVHHAKARFGGRTETDERRAAAARIIIKRLEQDFEDVAFVLLGDFNDNPDDESSNIMETGNAHAEAGAEDEQGTFLVNLTELLVAEDHVSWGRNTRNIVGGEKINTVDPGSRDRHNEFRGTDRHSGDILFDQILIPPRMLNGYVTGSVMVFDHPSGVHGNRNTRASDHLPVFAEFVFGGDSDGAARTGVRIISLLPNPEGTDRGNEQITLKNFGDESVPLDGWSLRDKAENTFDLDGQLGPGAIRTITLPKGKLPLNNGGDEIELLDRDREQRDVVVYLRAQARSGAVIQFE